MEWPPKNPPFSTNITFEAPLCFAEIAAHSPAMPPPRTKTLERTSELPAAIAVIGIDVKEKATPAEILKNCLLCIKCLLR